LPEFKKMKFIVMSNQICIIINNLCRYICIILIAILVSLITVEVFYRYILKAALSWPEELSGFCFVWLTMLGSALCLFNKSHIGVSILVDKFPFYFKKIIFILVYTIMLIFSYLMVTQGCNLLKIVSNQLSPAARLNMGLEYLAIPVAGAIFVLYCLVSILNFILTGDDKIRSNF
jgi:TRAP-type transport system small permease protein